jgi:transposase
MLTQMTQEDWSIAVEVFQALRSKRGEPGHDDRKFLEALHYFTVHNITWRALPAEFGNWNSVWKRFWRLSQTGTFDVPHGVSDPKHPDPGYRGHSTQARRTDTRHRGSAQRSSRSGRTGRRRAHPLPPTLRGPRRGRPNDDRAGRRGYGQPRTGRQWTRGALIALSRTSPSSVPFSASRREQIFQADRSASF